MIQELEIPREVPVMTLSSTALFPQAIMPLYIFEPRYREMLSEVLSSDRIFAIAAVNEDASSTEQPESPHRIGGVGLVRACRTNEDGSSNLVLQGLARVEFEEITTEHPYRKARIRQLLSKPGGPQDSLDAIKPRILELVREQMALGANYPKEVLQFLNSVEDTEAALDIAIYTLCASSALKQRLLETREVLSRYTQFEGYLQSEIERMKIDQDLKGDLGEDEVGNN